MGFIYFSGLLFQTTGKENLCRHQSTGATVSLDRVLNRVVQKRRSQNHDAVLSKRTGDSDVLMNAKRLCEHCAICSCDHCLRAACPGWRPNSLQHRSKNTISTTVDLITFTLLLFKECCEFSVSTQ